MRTYCVLMYQVVDLIKKCNSMHRFMYLLLKLIDVHYCWKLVFYVCDAVN